MTDTSPAHVTLRRGLQTQRVWLASGLILGTLAVIDPTQAAASAGFAANALLKTAPFLILSIAIAAWAGATGADNLIARAFTGAPVAMIGLGALAGVISPFCSCGVIPLIAALLTMGVPLSAVMAFWLASPIMDPSMFVLTGGVLGLEFAVAKTLAAFGLGVFGGLVVHLLARGGALADPLREGIGDGGCGGARVRAPRPVAWRFWTERERRAKFGRTAASTTLFLARWLTLAFILESLMLAWIPAETVTAALGGEGLMPIVTATLVGVPAYLNGYAALPLVGGLITQGMAPGAGMAFLVAGEVTSIPAVLAVPMAASLGLSPVWVFGAVSMAMVVSAMVGPWAGARIDGAGGRGVLIALLMLRRSRPRRGNAPGKTRFGSRSVGPGAPAVDREILGIAHRPDIRLARLGPDDHGVDAVAAGIILGSLAAVEGQPDLRLGVVGTGPAHQRVDLAGGGGGEVQNPVMGLGLAGLHRGPGGLVDAGAHGRDVLPRVVLAVMGVRAGACKGRHTAGYNPPRPEKPAP